VPDTTAFDPRDDKTSDADDAQAPDSDETEEPESDGMALDTILLAREVAAA